MTGETITLNGRVFNVVSSTKAAKTKKRPKYGNHKVTVFGRTFDSQREAQRYREIRVASDRGECSSIACQVPFVLAPAVRLLGEKRQKPALRYIADFVYYVAGERIVEDLKSEPTRKTAAFRIKLHLMKSVHGIDVRVVR